MNNYWRLAPLCLISGLLVSCSNEEPTPLSQAQSEPEIVQEEKRERRTGHLTGAATLVTLKIYEPNLSLETEFELTINTVDREDCFNVFENTEPWVSYCTHAQREKKPHLISGLFPQVQAGGEEVYGGEVLTSDNTSKYKMFLLPSLAGTLAIRNAVKADAEIQFNDPTHRFDDPEKKVTAAVTAINMRRQ